MSGLVPAMGYWDTGEAQDDRADRGGRSRWQPLPVPAPKVASPTESYLLELGPDPTRQRRGCGAKLPGLRQGAANCARSRSGPPMEPARTGR